MIREFFLILRVSDPEQASCEILSEGVGCQKPTYGTRGAPEGESQTESDRQPLRTGTGRHSHDGGVSRLTMSVDPD
jgi:hypothetical protein